MGRYLAKVGWARVWLGVGRCMIPSLIHPHSPGNDMDSHKANKRLRKGPVSSQGQIWSSDLLKG